MELDDICGSYKLTHFNTLNTPAACTMHVNREGENARVVFQVANTLRGRVKLEGDQISGMVMPTMMMGDADQAAIEDAISSGFSNGFTVRSDVDRILFKDADRSLVFARVMSLDDLVGEHAIISMDGHKLPVENLTIRFTPDGAGGSFVIANLTNSLRGDCRIEGGMLTGDVASTNMKTNSQMSGIESAITSGLRRGYTLDKNETGIVLESNNVRVQLYHITSRAELAGEYVLIKYNGEKVQTANQSTITFTPDNSTTDQIQIYMIVGNRIRGNVTLDQNVLRSDEPLLSTRLVSSAEEHTLEHAYNTGFQKGLEVVHRNKEVVLRDDVSEFILCRVPSFEYITGEPTYKGTYCGKCFKNEGNGLLFRITNKADKCWAFYNDSKDYRMIVHATFGSRSEIRALGNTRIDQQADGRYTVEVTVEPTETEMFIEGDVNGFNMVYNAEPI